MKCFNKLVRDRIPQIIRESGATAKIRTLSDAEFRNALEEKLDEEVAEFHHDPCADELADILEVVYALAKTMGYTREELLAAYKTKHDLRGGFDEKILLISTEEING